MTGTESGESLEIPMLEDLYGTTALDSCLGKLVWRDVNKGIFEFNRAAAENEMASVNKTMASVIFENIQDFSFMYLSTVDAIINAVGSNVPGIGDYLDARYIEDSYKVQQTSNRPFTSNALEILNIRDGEDVKKIEAGLCVIDAWAPESVVKRSLFQDKGHFKPYKMKYYDIPLIVQPT